MQPPSTVPRLGSSVTPGPTCVTLRERRWWSAGVPCWPCPCRNTTAIVVGAVRCRDPPRELRRLHRNHVPRNPGRMKTRAAVAKGVRMDPCRATRRGSGATGRPAELGARERQPDGHVQHVQIACRGKPDHRRTPWPRPILYRPRDIADDDRAPPRGEEPSALTCALTWSAAGERPPSVHGAQGRSMAHRSAEFSRWILANG